MENVRNRIDFELVTDCRRLNKVTRLCTVTKPFRIFSEYMVGIQKHKMQAILNKPISIGCSVLDVSKTLKYKFHFALVFNTIQPRFLASLVVIWSDIALRKCTCRINYIDHIIALMFGTELACVLASFLLGIGGLNRG